MFVFIPQGQANRSTELLKAIDSLTQDLHTKVEYHPKVMAPGARGPIITIKDLDPYIFYVEWEPLYTNVGKYVGHSVILPSLSPTYSEPYAPVKCTVKNNINGSAREIIVNIPVVSNTLHVERALYIKDVILHPFRNNFLFIGKRHVLEVRLDINDYVNSVAGLDVSITIVPSEPTITITPFTNLNDHFFVDVPNDPSLVGKDIYFDIFIDIAATYRTSYRVYFVGTRKQTQSIPIANIYVDPANGDDTFGDGSLDNPVRTLNVAVNILRSWVAGGTPGNLGFRRYKVGFLNNWQFAYTTPVDVTPLLHAVSFARVAYSFNMPVDIDFNGVPFIIQNTTIGANIGLVAFNYTTQILPHYTAQYGTFKISNMVCCLNNLAGANYILPFSNYSPYPDAGHIHLHNVHAYANFATGGSGGRFLFAYTNGGTTPYKMSGENYGYFYTTTPNTQFITPPQGVNVSDYENNVFYSTSNVGLYLSVQSSIEMQPIYNPLRVMTVDEFLYKHALF